MTSLVLENEPAASSVTVKDEQLIIILADGRTLSVPLAWYPRLLHATVAERQNVCLFGDGHAMEWPDLDEHIGIDGLLAGRRSSESVKSLQGWLESRRKSGVGTKET
jgi:Protein of unknown function (DUF2442)